MFKKVDPGFDFLSREQEVLKLWKDREIFKKSIDQREGSDAFTFYDGPKWKNCWVWTARSRSRPTA